MLNFDFLQTYPNFFGIILIVTGVLVILVDVKVYQTRKLLREMSWAKALGWTNMSIGIFSLVFNWVYRYFYW